MKIIFYRYGSICEPDVLEAFKSCGISVIEENTEIHQKKIAPMDRIRLIGELVLTHRPTFVFSINFFPYISDICEKLHVIYVCLSVDCPVLELFSVSIRNRCNRIFLFDYTQYQTFYPENPDCIFYLPLATNADRWDTVLADLTAEDLHTYSSDISFVGSLYHEKSPLSLLHEISPLPEYWDGYVKGLTEAQLGIYGYNLLEEAIPTELITCLKQTFPNYLCLSNAFTDTDRYVAAHYYLGMRVSEAERVHALNTLAKDFSVRIYTRSDTSLLQNVDCRGGVTTHIEMPKIFHLSKINLNITIKSIQSGLSLRVWDILGCGGFLLSNYQSEIPEYFEIGKDLDCYESMNDLKNKVQYYLMHDDIRREIAQNGYKKVKVLHSYKARIATMLRTLFTS